MDEISKSIMAKAKRLCIEPATEYKFDCPVCGNKISALKSFQGKIYAQCEDCGKVVSD